jgi:hypothetical protein
LFCPINNFTEVQKFCEDRVGSGGPDEGTAMQIVLGDIGVDLWHQLVNAAERAAPNCLLGASPAEILRHFCLRPSVVVELYFVLRSPLSVGEGGA